MTPPPQVSEALVLANLCSTVADALKKAALDLRMIDSRDRERKHERVREVMEKAKQMALVEVARQHGLTSALICDEPDNAPAQCRCCGAISYESVCPDCGGTAWVPAGTAERDLPESAIWWFGGR